MYKFLAVFLCSCVFIACSSHIDYTSWNMYGGNSQNNHYSSLSQIDTNNVTQLKVAWVYHTGDMDTANHSQIQCNPIIVDCVLYGTSPLMKLFAIDAATGAYPAVTTDMDGQPRKAPLDIGADEVSAAPVTAAILSVSQVGYNATAPAAKK